MRGYGIMISTDLREILINEMQLPSCDVNEFYKFINCKHNRHKKDGMEGLVKCKDGYVCKFCDAEITKEKLNHKIDLKISYHQRMTEELSSYKI